jgi:hypothetical protein
MRGRDSWYGLYSELYKKLEDIADEYSINPKHKSFPANSIVLSKRITAIKSNLETVGITFVRDAVKAREGQRLSIKRINSSAPYASSAQSADNGGLTGADDGADKNNGESSAHLSAPPKACNNGACVDGDDGADKILSLEDWGTVTDEEVPAEFL